MPIDDGGDSKFLRRKTKHPGYQDKSRFNTFSDNLTTLFCDVLIVILVHNGKYRKPTHIIVGRTEKELPESHPVTT